MTPCILDTLQIPVYKSRLMLPRYTILLQLTKSHIHLNTSLMIFFSRAYEKGKVESILFSKNKIRDI